MNFQPQGFFNRLSVGLLALTIVACVSHQLSKVQFPPGVVIDKFGGISGTDAVWSPDGRQFAFVQQPISGGEPPGNGSLSLFDVSTGNVRDLKISTPPHSWPSWSPLSTKLVIQRGDNRIWLVDTTDNSAKDLVEGAGAAWSPDGKVIVVIQGPRLGNANSNFRLVLVTPDGHYLKRIAEISPPPPSSAATTPTQDMLGTFAGMAWSPDGERIVVSINFVKENQGPLFIVKSDGTGLYQITPKRFSQQPVWSPDGRKIAYLSFYSSRDLFTFDLSLTRWDGQCTTALIESGYLDSPNWSADGHELALLEYSSDNLYVLDAAALIGNSGFNQCVDQHPYENSNR